MTDEELLLHQLKNPPTMSMALNKDHLYRMMADHMKGAADRIESLTEQLEAARAEANEVIDKQGALLADAYGAYLDWDEVLKDRADHECKAKLAECEARLGKAVDALTFYADFHENPNDGPWGVSSQDFGKHARALLAEIEGKTPYGLEGGNE
jgi:hypothetical protein